MTRTLRSPYVRRRALSVASIVAATLLVSCGVVRFEDQPFAKRSRSAVCVGPVLPTFVPPPLPASPDSMGAWAAESAARSAAVNSEAAQAIGAYHRCLAFGDTLS